jgi:hypothetical protein
MRTVQTLIDAATVKCGSQAELARRLRMHRSEVTEYKTGVRVATPEVVGLLCDLLDVPPDEAREIALRAVIDAPRNAERRGALERAFFACWAVGAVVCGAVATIPKTVDAAEVPRQGLTLYTLCQLAGLFQRLRSSWDRMSFATTSDWLRPSPSAICRAT